MDKEAMKDFIYKPLLTGGAGYLGSMALVDSRIKVGGWSANAIIGGVLVAGSLANEVVNDTIYETLLPDNESELVESLVSPVICGGATVLAMKAYSGAPLMSYPMLQLFALGAISDIVGQYANDNILGPAVDLY